jgi:hypothetical protein
MKPEEIKIGMKVVPINKSIGFGGPGLERSFAWREAQKNNQPYIFVTGTDKDYPGAILCAQEANKNTGDYFLPKDLIPYDEIIKGENK